MTRYQIAAAGLGAALLAGCGGQPDVPEPCVDEQYYVDEDGDGYGSDPVLACEVPSAASELSGDCDDARPDVYPGAPESDCTDPVDYNCDGVGAGTDGDGDGWVGCDDCDDGDSTIHPDSTEVCDGVDNNCDGDIDVDAEDALDWYVDSDGDGVGAPTNSVEACTAPPNYVATSNDCDDADDRRYPGAIEVCDGVDNDCDNLADGADAAGAIDWYIDQDGDGYGSTNLQRTHCDPGPDGVDDTSDCNDLDIYIFPGAAETCDGLDNDCDGAIDEDPAVGAPIWHADDDQDGYGNPAAWVASCTGPIGWIADGTDCDDLRPDVYPGAEEFCSGIDENCDGTIDNDDATDAPVWNIDADLDGYGGAGVDTACQPAPGLVGNSDDCNDGDPAISPGETEVCDPADVDENCDGLSDDLDPSVDVASLLDMFIDLDGDGFGDAVEQRCDPGPDSVFQGGDCQDGDPTINPGAIEQCDAVDWDCSGTPDDADAGAPTWYLDADGDGYGDPGDSVQSCSPVSGFELVPDDCNDADPNINPSAEESCWNAIDEDCDGDITLDDDDCAPTGSNGVDDPILDVRTWSGDGDHGASVDFVDFNGDGLSDLVVGNPSTDTAYVFLAPLPVDTLASAADVVLTGSGSFGTVVLGAGDYTGDGIDDIAVSAPDFGFGAGRISIFAGSAFPAAQLDEIDAWLLLDGEREGDRVGGAMDAHDVDGDGLSELAIGGLTHCDERGAVYVVAGGSTDPALANAATILMGAHHERAGTSLAWAGDVNADGQEDLVVGAPGVAAGQVYLVYGALPLGRANLAIEADAVITGDQSGDLTGSAVAGPGDLDLDGYDDIVIGAMGYNATGAIGVFYGPLLMRDHLFADTPVLITGPGSSEYGATVAPAGDVDGDGYPDLLVGAPAASASRGQVYLYYSPLVGLTSSFSGADDGDRLGASIAGGGDVDGDGYTDLAMGAPDAGGIDGGAAYVVLGGSRLDQFDVAAVPDRTEDLDGDGFSEATGDCDDSRADMGPGLVEICEDLIDNDCDGFDDLCAPLGLIALEDRDADLVYSSSISVVPIDTGDFNGDMIDDVLVGTGRSACVYLGPVPPGVWELEDASVCYRQEESLDDAGIEVTTIGDFNGDGIDDFAVGADKDEVNLEFYGKIYIILGTDLCVEPLLADADLIFTGEAPGAFAGNTMAAAGDVNGDGLDDLLVGVRYDNSAYVIYGGTPPGAYNLSEAGTIIRGPYPDTFGHQVAGAGDVNGDGFDDIIVTSEGDYNFGYNGSTVHLFLGPLEAEPRVFFAHASFVHANRADEPFDPLIQSAEHLASADIDGDGYSDVMITKPDGILIFLGPIDGTLHFDDDADITIEPAAVGGEDCHMATGDVDADGYVDLLLSCALHHLSDSQDEGGLYLFYGPLDAAVPVLNMADSDADIVSHFGDINDRRYFRTSVGDVNADGYGDILMTARYSDGGGTNVLVTLGGRRGDPAPFVPPIPDPTDDGDGDGFTELGGDCDDTDANVFPGQLEICDDGIDSDCLWPEPTCAMQPIATTRTYFANKYRRNVGESLAAADFDLDGYTDIVIGMDDNPQSAVYLVHGPFALGRYELTSEVELPTFAAGAHAAAGDLDGDGLPDLAYSASYAYEVLINYGPNLDVVGTRLNGQMSIDALVVTDPDQTGTDNLIVGDSSDDVAGVGAGAVFLFDDNPGIWIGPGDAPTVIQGEPGDSAGEMLAVGDVSGDGAVDYVLGTHLVLGPIAGVVSLASADLEFAVETPPDYINNATTVGDVDDDGIVDLVIGVGLVNASAGRAYLFTSVPVGPVASLATADLQFDGEGPADTLGKAASAGDMNNDGADDLLLSATGYSGRSGRAYLFFGALAAGGNVDVAAASDVIINATGRGEMLSIGDTNGDGLDDLILGSEGDWGGNYTVLFYGWQP